MPASSAALNLPATTKASAGNSTPQGSEFPIDLQRPIQLLAKNLYDALQ
jgi:hypothetical protein